MVALGANSWDPLNVIEAEERINSIMTAHGATPANREPIKHSFHFLALCTMLQHAVVKMESTIFHFLGDNAAPSSSSN